MSPLFVSILLCIYLLNIVTPQQVSCNTMDDCSYNGICKNNICECFPQWKGAHCASLNIIAGTKNAGLQSKVNGSRATTYDFILIIIPFIINGIQYIKMKLDGVEVLYMMMKQNYIIWLLLKWNIHVV